jgi:hypothetical protein
MPTTATDEDFPNKLQRRHLHELLIGLAALITGLTLYWWFFLG